MGSKLTYNKKLRQTYYHNLDKYFNNHSKKKNASLE